MQYFLVCYFLSFPSLCVHVHACTHKPSASIQTSGTSATPLDFSDLMDYRSATSLVNLLRFKRNLCLGLDTWTSIKQIAPSSFMDKGNINTYIHRSCVLSYHFFSHLGLELFILSSLPLAIFKILFCDSWERILCIFLHSWNNILERILKNIFWDWVLYL